MLHIKEYFTEGLIQMAILLSLCGVRVHVGLEVFLPPSWCELILGPTSALTHTQILNLRNRHSLHPKMVDLDQFFTARRLFGWVRSLDQIQVSQAELETWLVQQEVGPLSGRFPDQNFLIDRTLGQVERDQSEPTMGQGEVLDSLEEEEQVCQMITHHNGQHDASLLFYLHRKLGSCFPGRFNFLTTITVQDKISENTTVVAGLPVTLHNPGCELIAMGSAAPNVSLERLTVSVPASFSLKIIIQIYECGAPLNENIYVMSEVSTVWTPLSPSRPAPDVLTLITTLLFFREPLGLDLELQWQDLMDILEPEVTNRVRRDANACENSRMDSWTIPSNYADLLDENPGGDNLAVFSMDLLTQDISPFSSDSSSYDLKTPSGSQASGGNDLDQDFGRTSSSSFELAEEGADGFPGHIRDLLENLNILEDIQLLDGQLEEGFSPDVWAEAEVETDSDSGLSLDFIHSPSSFSSPIVSEGSADDSSSCASAVENVFSDEVDSSDEDGSAGSHLEVEVTIKQEEVEEEMGAVGGHGVPQFPPNHEDSKLFPGFSWVEHIGHDHTYYNPPLSSPAPGTMSPIQTESAVRAGSTRPCCLSSSSLAPETKAWSRDEERARALRIPFSYQLIVNLPVEEFNHLLSSSQLSQQQLTLIRDIRRRGKNKIAAQNCRKRKLDVLLALEEDLKALRLHRSKLLQEKRNSLRRLQDMKSRFGKLYQEIFSQLEDDNGRPLDATEYTLRFGPDDTVTVASIRASQNGKKHQGVKKRRS
uniref:Endoplasmic reticulum membrane sensor NFE2L1 n=1 Tax=Poecilia formosa TaxID=48698 RepID=A0A087XQT2_POEFO